MKRFIFRLLGVIALALLGIAFATAPSTEVVQWGHDGNAMELVYTTEDLVAREAANKPPPMLPSVGSDGPRAGDTYQNVQVLGGLSVGEFLRLMTSITLWVAPEQGCNYCHNGQNLASDEVYAKVVSRRMLQMTQHINSTWKQHVGSTGVTCYTCHRGLNVPANIWFEEPESPYTARLVGDPAGQNRAAASVGVSSLPSDPFTPYLASMGGIRVVSTQALPGENRSSIKQTEWTYGLMMHMSNALGANCTFCHNSRNFSGWEGSPPQRTTAWYGIRMVRDLNANFLDPLGPTYPAHRLGPGGDAPKANCATCHQGVNKPLLGHSLLEAYPELAAPRPFTKAAGTSSTSTTAQPVGTEAP